MNDPPVEATIPPVTPETLREQGVHVGQVDHHVLLHEKPVRLQAAEVLSREAAADGRGEIVTFRADIAICDIINQNYRYYPRSAYEAANKRAEPDMANGMLTMLLEHPGWEDGWKGRLEAVAARWTKLGIDEKEVEFPPKSGQMVKKPVVWGEGVYTRNPSGQLVQSLIADKVYVGISTNGYSSIEWVRFGDLGVEDPTGLIDPDLEIPVTGDDFTYLTIDAVSLPANSGGQVYAESGGYGPPPVRTPPAVPPSPPVTAPAHPPVLEDTMHPKLKALCERLGKPLEQVKTEHASDYLSTLEAIAADNQASTESVSQLASVQAQLVQTQTQLAQTQEALRVSESHRVQESRTAMVDQALAEANLPQLPPLELGETTVDLNAQFREGLLAAALAADSDEAAQTLVTRQITIRAHELAGTKTEGVPSVQPVRAPARAPGLPEGNNDRPDPLSVATESISVLSANPYINRLRS